MDERMLTRSQLFVSTPAHEARAELLDFLEKEGFGYFEHTSKNDVMESIFPVTVEMKEHKIWHLGNVTCSACAAQAKLIMHLQEFYEVYEIRRAAEKSKV